MTNEGFKELKEQFVKANGIIRAIDILTETADRCTHQIDYELKLNDLCKQLPYNIYSDVKQGIVKLFREKAAKLEEDFNNL